jgi:hypothetical protein
MPYNATLCTDDAPAWRHVPERLYRDDDPPRLLSICPKREMRPSSTARAGIWSVAHQWFE